jgi:hypothetical protein
VFRARSVRTVMASHLSAVPAFAERDILDRIRAAGIRLRFDKVVLRLVGGLQDALNEVVPSGRAIIFTVTAPIRAPAKTAATLEKFAIEGNGDGERIETIHGNRVRIRWLTNVSPGSPRVLGFVHDQGINAGLILDLAAERLSV